MKKPKRKTVLLVLLLVVIAVCLGQIPVRRMLGYLNDLDEKIARCQFQLNQDKQEIQDNTQFVQNWNNIENFLKEPQGQSQLGTYLQELQRKSEIQITNFAGFFENNLEDHPEFQIFGYDTLKFSCDLRGLVEFLARLDAEDQRLLRITRIKIDATAASPKAAPPPTSAVMGFESNLPGTVPADLSVVMAISIPVAAQTPETAMGQEDRF
ncbi:hypothetical protein ACFL02_00895 [Planctomycetota bacterium]